MNFTAAEVIDFIENKVQIDVRLLSAEEINKTTEVFGCAIEMIERAELMQAELEKAHDEAVKDFCHFLIDKAEGGEISICDLPELIVEWGGLPQTAEPTVPSEKVADIKNMNFYYKLGVLNKTLLLDVYEFDDFEKMMQIAKSIDCKYGSDMDNCHFVIQSFKDNSYDFRNSCFSQINIPIKNIEGQIDKLTKEIMADFKNIKSSKDGAENG